MKISKKKQCVVFLHNRKDFQTLDISLPSSMHGIAVDILGVEEKSLIRYTLPTNFFYKLQ
jgi:hypothetical protein